MYSQTFTTIFCRSGETFEAEPINFLDTISTSKRMKEGRILIFNILIFGLLLVN